jgi:NAD(P)-dependent dehydrogenase (short-subunit alcohol dehydrogenase family)
VAARNILITGGMGGIGKSCVQKFITQGDQVVFTYAEEVLTLFFVKLKTFVSSNI